jgi:hypothetical protein
VVQSLGGAKGVVIMGDSLVEDAKFPAEVCGLPIVNAGLGGSGAATFIPIAQTMGTAPAPIIVSVGINDRANGKFAAAYSMLLDSLPKTRVALVSLAQSGASETDQKIREIAGKHHVGLIDVSAIPNFETRDGFHPVERSYKDWRRRVLDGARSALDCDTD